MIERVLDTPAASFHNLPTPFLCLDGPTVKRNIERLADYARTHRLGLRPHTKTHKSQRIGRLQLDAGAIGLTVAKAGEAEVMSAVCDDILVAYPVVDPARARRIANVARETKVTVAIDSRSGIAALQDAASEAGSTIGILIDQDVGVGRTGVQTVTQTVELATSAAQATNLSLRGLFIYPGHVKGPPDEQEHRLAAISALVAESLDCWRAKGLNTEIVSGGSTPSAYRSHLIPQLTEFRPGTYVYNDMNIVRGGYCQLDDCAARIVCTVVSNAVPDQVVLDAGSKALTSDLCGPAPGSGHGYLVEFPRAKITRLTEEHGQVDVSACDTRPQLGQRVTVIPNHICVCVNMQDRVWWREGTDSETLEPLTVDARGMLC
jgi:D-serine deaminase-like pyridoxal phosphate-dependent protein